MNLIFLLGGYDLEMIEIKKLLHIRGEVVLDKHLSWGAKLSAYQQHFNKENHFVSIELIPDCNPPEYFTEIDHHNDKSDLPSSIEQVAELLNHKLNRFQKLVAANDKGYIPAMKEIGASQQEIEEIRRLDRQAQGVTEDDEKLAEKSITENLSKHGTLTIVHSLTSKFSAITDRLYPYNQLLVHHNDQLVYYGKFAASLAKHYQELINNQQAFSGGGPDGFFGISAGSMTPNKITEIKSEIIQHTKHL